MICARGFGVVDSGVDFVLDDDSLTFVELESFLEPLAVSFRRSALRNEGCEVVRESSAGTSPVGLLGEPDEVSLVPKVEKERRVMIPHEGHLDLSFAIAVNLCPLEQVNSVAIHELALSAAEVNKKKPDTSAYQNN